MGTVIFGTAKLTGELVGAEAQTPKPFQVTKGLRNGAWPIHFGKERIAKAEKSKVDAPQGEEHHAYVVIP